VRSAKQGNLKRDLFFFFPFFFSPHAQWTVPKRIFEDLEQVVRTRRRGRTPNLFFFFLFLFPPPLRLVGWLHLVREIKSDFFLLFFPPPFPSSGSCSQSTTKTRMADPRDEHTKNGSRHPFFSFSPFPTSISFLALCKIHQ